MDKVNVFFIFWQYIFIYILVALQMYRFTRYVFDLEACLEKFRIILTKYLKFCILLLICRQTFKDKKNV